MLNFAERTGSGAVMLGLGNGDLKKGKRQKENNTWDSNVVPHRSTNQARTCLTSLSGREAVLSCWYGRSQNINVSKPLETI